MTLAPEPLDTTYRSSTVVKRRVDGHWNGGMRRRRMPTAGLLRATAGAMSEGRVPAVVEAGHRGATRPPVGVCQLARNHIRTPLRLALPRSSRRRRALRWSVREP